MSSLFTNSSTSVVDIDRRQSKRQKTDHTFPKFRSINIPKDTMDEASDEFTGIISQTEVFPFDDITAWGPLHVATARALLESETTPENERFLRSHHPAFANSASVWLAQERSGRRIWILRDGAPTAHIRAGGLEVHQAPLTRFSQTQGVFRFHEDLIRRKINPRQLLTESDLVRFREMFPRAIGVRIYLAGCIVVLYRSADTLYNDLEAGVVYEVGGLRIQFDVLDLVPSSSDEPVLGTDQTVIPHAMNAEIGGPLADKPSATTPAACVGVRIQLPDGRRAITTVTHGFVYLPGNANRVVRMFNWLWAETRALLRFKTPKATNAYLPIVTTRTRSYLSKNTSLNKDVWLMTTGTRLGTIQCTFDEPSSYIPYPHGYRCDLSLVLPIDDDQATTFPYVSPASGMPAIDGWADLGIALAGAPVFVTANLVHASGRTTVAGRSLAATDKHEVFEDIKLQKRDAVIEGTQYLWDHQACEQTGSLLWRTEANSEDGPEQLLGFSGSLLCLGRPTDRRAKALLFQNFQIPYPSPRIGDRTIRPQDRASWNVKGGFFLPSFILSCDIETGELVRPDRP